jgi:hypothetical protein
VQFVLDKVEIAKGVEMKRRTIVLAIIYVCLTILMIAYAISIGDAPNYYANAVSVLSLVAWVGLLMRKRLAWIFLVCCYVFYFAFAFFRPAIEDFTWRIVTAEAIFCAFPLFFLLTDPPRNWGKRKK